MSPRCIKISSCVCFFVFSYFLLYIAGKFAMVNQGFQHYSRDKKPTGVLRFSNTNLHAQCDLDDLSIGNLTTPSMESFIRASSTVEDLRLSGLAVYSNLTDACRPPVDVSNSNFHVSKIALITIANATVCPLRVLAKNAQNAGYSVVIYYGHSLPQSNASGTQNHIEDKLLISILHSNYCSSAYPDGHTTLGTDYEDVLINADQSNVEISVLQNELNQIQWYLRTLYVWFLLGPLITLEWLRRTKKFCCMSGGPGVIEEPRGTEDEGTGGETILQSVVEENNNQEQTEGEEHPLIIITHSWYDPDTYLTTTNEHARKHKRRKTVRRVANLFGKVFAKLAVGCGYLILIVAALPVGLSSGGWSFFRFDENQDTQQKSFWDDLFLKFDRNFSDLNFNWQRIGIMRFYPISIFQNFLPLWWSPFQIFCFFLYSRFACKTTWTVPTNFSKLIRSDWFASNIYLLIFGVAVPYCSFDFKSFWAVPDFIYFTTYNTVCTVCNLLFIIIFNKHRFVTRYVFYIGVCMICAYVQSNIVAAFCYVLNSQGSLANLKLTALLTVAIGLTLTLSFSSSMHIIRKLTKPRESLIEGLGEK